MRDEETLQKVHDVLAAVITKQAPSPFREEVLVNPLVMYCETLCWVLEHNDCTTSFERNLEKIDMFLVALGYKIIKVEVSA